MIILFGITCPFSLFTKQVAYQQMYFAMDVLSPFAIRPEYIFKFQTYFVHRFLHEMYPRCVYSRHTFLVSGIVSLTFVENTTELQRQEHFPCIKHFDTLKNVYFNTQTLL